MKSIKEMSSDALQNEMNDLLNKIEENIELLIEKRFMKSDFIYILSGIFPLLAGKHVVAMANIFDSPKEIQLQKFIDCTKMAVEMVRNKKEILQ